MIPTSNRFCTNMEDKTLILQKEILLLASLDKSDEKIFLYPPRPETLVNLGACPEKKISNRSL